MGENMQVGAMQLPDWARQLLNDEPALSEAEITQYDYIKADFHGALAQLRSLKKGTAHFPATDTVFTLLGQLLRTGVDRIAPMNQLCPVAALSRSAPSTGASSVPGTRISGIKHVVSGAYTEVINHAVSGGIEIEINLRSEKDDREIRPFKVSVYDDTGVELVSPVTVGMMEQSPRFPGPQPGIYRFQIEWQGGQDTLFVEYQ